MTEAEPLVEATTVGAARLSSASPPFVSAGFTESSRSSAVDDEDDPTPFMPVGGSQPPSSSTRAKASPSRMHRLRGSQDRFAAEFESYNSTNDHNQMYGNRQDPRQSETRRDWLVLQKARRLLYVSHFFAQFSEVAWQFSLILFLAAITNYQSLVLVSTYGLVAGLSVCLFGSTAGRYVDGTNRLVAAQFFIWTENVCVLIATAFCYRLLQARQDPDEPPTLIPDDATSPMLSSPTWLQSMSQHVPLDHLSLFCLLGIHVFGPIAQILDRGFLVAIERDWVVIMSQAAVEEPEQLPIGPDASLPPCSDPQEEQFQRQAAAMKGWLSETNVTMKQIDLSCKVVAPAIAGFIVGAFDSQQRGSSGGGGGGDDALSVELSGDAALGDRSGSNLKGAAVLVGVVNIIALVVEYYCTRQIYQMIPALAVKCEASDESQWSQHNSGGDSSTSQHGLMQLLPMGSPLPRGRTGGSGVEQWAIVQRPWRVPTALQIYLDQPVSKAGLALSLLYLNALTFGALMTAYLVWRGMRLETVGVWRGISSAIGLAGTFVYYCSARRLTVVETGMWSICYQLAFITVSFGALFVSEYRTSMALLILGVCASRIGLWTFDIAVTQLMQEHIPDGIRGVVGGTQQALNAFFQLLSYALGLIYPDPSEFNVYVAAGYAAVVIGCLLYTLGVYRKAGDFVVLQND